MAGHVIKTEKWMSAGPAAEALGVTRQTINRWIDAGIMKASRHHPRGNWRIRVSEVERMKLPD